MRTKLIVRIGAAWKVSKYGVISGPYFPVLALNTGKYGPEITPNLNTFQAVDCTDLVMATLINDKQSNIKHLCLIKQINLQLPN